jgi:uncharacterized membrane protein YgcG
VSKTKIVALGLLGTIVPVALAFTAFFISRSTIGSASNLPGVSVPRMAPDSASPSVGMPKTPKTPGQGTDAPSASPSPTVTDDHGGRCSEPEHTADPTCSDSSGKGGGSGDDSNPDNSGKGSSGSGGGDD